jgi:hypothetical protein
MKLPFPTQAPSIAAALAACCALLPLDAATQQPVLLDQGSDWTASARSDYYSRSQGSQIIPLRWISALKQSNGQPFMAESLSRYGYLPNPDSNPPGLPVGFTAANSGTHGEIMGMTCSACHTRQIEVAGTPYRADGGPAIVDFQSFLQDLDAAVQTLLKDPQAFKAFADEVLGPGAPSDKVTALHRAVTDWALPYHTLMQQALPTPAWGPSRLDAVAMIFNRLVGLDIGPPPTYLIPENIHPADAPVRYPFLWNAPKQDFTQWPGFAANGTPLLGLTRNLGEVYGVFADFKPSKDGSPLGIDYTGVNSADFSGLSALEDLIGKIGPPKWPWPVNQALAKQGQALYEKPGGCADCHGIKTSWKRFPHTTWATPICDVGTDRREYAVLQRRAKTGVLDGARVPGLPPSRISANDAASSVLGVAVIGAILQHYAPLSKDALSAQSLLAPSVGTAGWLSSSLNRADLDQLLSTYDPLKQPLLKGSPPSAIQPTPSACSPASASAFAYESRVRAGIWAAAPYLHNGSVRSLADLLKPSSERASEFKIGPNYDTANIGLAVDQTRFDYVLKTTDCSAISSGSSRCGHEGPSYGTTLSPDEKAALLEYLKTL